MKNGRQFGWVHSVRRRDGCYDVKVRLDDGAEVYRRVPWCHVPVGALLGRRAELVPWGYGLTLWGR